MKILFEDSKMKGVLKVFKHFGQYYIDSKTLVET